MLESLGVESPDVSNNSHTQPPVHSVDEVRVNMITAPGHETKLSLFNLRARYSRALCRASYQLIFHGEGSAPIERGPLTYLLDSISVAGRSTSLKLESQTFLSTHHPQADDHVAPKFWVHVVGAQYERYLEPLNVGDEDGLIVGILRVLGSANIESAPVVELAAGKAFAATFPDLMAQWLRMNPDLLPGSTLSLVEALLNWTNDSDVADSNDSVNQTIRLLLIAATVGVSCAGCLGILELPEQAMLAFYSRARLPSGRIPAFHVLRDNRDILQSLIMLIDLKHEQLNLTTYKAIIGLLAIKYYTSPILGWIIDFEQLPEILHILAITPGCGPDVKALLSEIEICLTTWNNFVKVFIESGRGFSQLVAAAKHPEYTSAVIKCIATITSVAANSISDHVEDAQMLPPAIPGFLDGVALVLGYLDSRGETPPEPTAFMRATLSLLHNLQDDAKIVLANHASTKMICQILGTSTDISSAGSELLLELVEMQEFTEAQDLPLRWLPLLFEE